MTTRSKRRTKPRTLISCKPNLLTPFQKRLPAQLPESTDDKLRLWSATWAQVRRRHPSIMRRPGYSAALLASIALCGIDLDNPQLDRRPCLPLRTDRASISAAIACGSVTRPEFGNPQHIWIHKTLTQQQ